MIPTITQALLQLERDDPQEAMRIFEWYYTEEPTP